jgi:uncharacterized membrane protein YqjE
VGASRAHENEDASAGGHGAAVDPSVSSAIEHLVASSEGVIADRIDLAMLEGQGVLSRALQRGALVGLGMVLGAGAWFAAAASLVLLMTPNATLVLRLAAFALLNAAGASGFVALAMRARQRTPVRTSGDVSGATRGP